MAEADWIEQILERPAIMCSQGGVPYNDFHLKEKDAMIASLRAQLADARAQERERCAKVADAEAARWTKPNWQDRKATEEQRGAFSSIANVIAQRIRALSPTPHQEKKE